MAGLDDQIKRWVQDAEASGELRESERYGKPLDLDDGWLDTPTELRVAFKVLKNGGYLPPALELRKRMAELREKLAAATDDAERAELQRQLIETQTRLAVATESLRS